MRQLAISVAPEARRLGIDIAGALFAVVEIADTNARLEDKKKEIVEKAAHADVAANSVLAGYRELYQRCNTTAIPPAEQLVQSVRKNGRLPNINTVVDSYNLVSAETLLSIGAHDLDKIEGNVIIKITDGSEWYIPLGSQSPEKVAAGEYACMDEEKIICRMDVRQCEQTKITKDTRRFIVYVQGNENTDAAYLKGALGKVSGYLAQFCGARIISSL